MFVHLRRPKLPAGRPRHVVKVRILEDRSELPRVGLRALQGTVLHVEDRFSGRGPVRQSRSGIVAFVVLEALLIHGKIEIRLEGRELTDVVLETDGEPDPVRKVGKVRIELQLIVRGERKPGTILIAVDVVPLDGIEAGLHALLRARREDRTEEVDATDVHPTFTRPTVLPSEHDARVLVRVRTPVLPGAGVQVADRARALGVDGARRGGIHLVDASVDGAVDVQVDVEDLRCDGGSAFGRNGGDVYVDAAGRCVRGHALELVLQACSDRRLPAAGTRSRGWQRREGRGGRGRKDARGADETLSMRIHGDRSERMELPGGAMDTLLLDLRLGWRALRRNTAFSAAALLTLALGIGGTCAIFGVLNAVFLRPLPFEEEARLVRLRDFTAAPGGAISPVNITGRHFLEILAQSRTLSGISAQTGR